MSKTPTGTRWDTRRARRADRLRAAGPFARGPIVETADVGKLLEAVLRPGDRVVLEGDNQKQADFLSRSLAPVAGSCGRSSITETSSVCSTATTPTTARARATVLGLTELGRTHNRRPGPHLRGARRSTGPPPS
jgi:hypothetical protein